MRITDSEKRGVLAGSVLAVILTGVLTFQADAQIQTFLVTLGACVVAIGLAWGGLHLYLKAKGPQT